MLSACSLLIARVMKDNRVHKFTFWQVLLVSEDENDGVPHLPVVDDPVELLPGLVYPVPVRAVHHEDEPLRARVVVPPQWPDLVLATHILRTEQLTMFETSKNFLNVQRTRARTSSLNIIECINAVP